MAEDGRVGPAAHFDVVTSWHGILRRHHLMTPSFCESRSSATATIFQLILEMHDLDVVKSTVHLDVVTS